MTLADLISTLCRPDCAPDDDSPLDMEVVFDTSDRGGLELLSVYCGDDGKIHIDIGEDGE